MGRIERDLLKKEQMFVILIGRKGTDMEEKWKYEDMLNMPHYVSKNHSRMSMMDRAAQFAPFAALTGHEKQVKETAEKAKERIECREVEAIVDV